MEVVRLKYVSGCGNSTLAGAVKVRLRYGESTREVRRKYG